MRFSRYFTSSVFAAGLIVAFSTVAGTSEADTTDCMPTPPNGCGPANSFISDKAIKDSFGDVHFGWCCTNHDNCYNNLTQSKRDCDDNFHSDMTAECLKDASGFPYLRFLPCMIAADSYYKSVDWFAGTAYSESQACVRQHNAYLAAHANQSSPTPSLPPVPKVISARLANPNKYADGTPVAVQVFATISGGTTPAPNAKVSAEWGQTFSANAVATIAPRLVTTTINGHTFIRPPLLFVTATGFTGTSLAVPMNVPALDTTVAPTFIQCGTSTITVTLTDHTSKAPRSGDVYVNGAFAGKTDAVITIAAAAHAINAPPNAPGVKAQILSASQSECDLPEVWVKAAGYSDTLVWKPVRLSAGVQTQYDFRQGSFKPPISNQANLNMQNTHSAPIPNGPAMAPAPERR